MKSQLTDFGVNTFEMNENCKQENPSKSGYVKHMQSPVDEHCICFGRYSISDENVCSVCLHIKLNGT